jgi:hypothetical protein
MKMSDDMEDIELIDRGRYITDSPVPSPMLIHKRKQIIVISDDENEYEYKDIHKKQKVFTNHIDQQPSNAVDSQTGRVSGGEAFIQQSDQQLDHRRYVDVGSFVWIHDTNEELEHIGWIMALHQNTSQASVVTFCSKVKKHYQHPTIKKYLIYHLTVLTQQEKDIFLRIENIYIMRDVQCDLEYDHSISTNMFEYIKENYFLHETMKNMIKYGQFPIINQVSVLTSSSKVKAHVHIDIIITRWTSLRNIVLDYDYTFSNHYLQLTKHRESHGLHGTNFTNKSYINIIDVISLARNKCNEKYYGDSTIEKIIDFEYETRYKCSLWVQLPGNNKAAWYSAWFDAKRNAIPTYRIPGGGWLLTPCASSQIFREFVELNIKTISSKMLILVCDTYMNAMELTFTRILQSYTAVDTNTMYICKDSNDAEMIKNKNGDFNIIICPISFITSNDCMDQYTWNRILVISPSNNTSIQFWNKLSYMLTDSIWMIPLSMSHVSTKTIVQSMSVFNEPEVDKVVHKYIKFNPDSSECIYSNTNTADIGRVSAILYDRLLVLDYDIATVTNNHVHMLHMDTHTVRNYTVLEDEIQEELSNDISIINNKNRNRNRNTKTRKSAIMAYRNLHMTKLKKQEFMQHIEVIEKLRNECSRMTHLNKELVGYKQFQSLEYDCPICLCYYRKPLQIQTCKHTFCTKCIHNWIQITQDRNNMYTDSINEPREILTHFECPLCKVDFERTDLHIAHPVYGSVAPLDIAFGDRADIITTTTDDQLHSQLGIVNTSKDEAKDIQPFDKKQCQFMLSDKQVKYQKILEIINSNDRKTCVIVSHFMETLEQIQYVLNENGYENVTLITDCTTIDEAIYGKNTIDSQTSAVTEGCVKRHDAARAAAVILVTTNVLTTCFFNQGVDVFIVVEILIDITERQIIQSVPSDTSTSIHHLILRDTIEHRILACISETKNSCGFFYHPYDISYKQIMSSTAVARPMHNTDFWPLGLHSPVLFMDVLLDNKYQSIYFPALNM